ncbi:DUF2066 domain-containing protein [Pseudoxanthomonas koreensis]|uniref:DUF2066 domain-containing protein n=1 Tax=Pseudoxanthomonas koreensis TaxID=266061 RepID=UPI001EE4166C|nr:DUF2066 domain-containing protein [Pseudoxanthomonas koreensis]KAF1691171.1 hypothetical protein CSC64_10090 [Pseudoxanthomonas koreensis]
MLRLLSAALCLCGLLVLAMPVARAQAGLRTEGDVAAAQGLYSAEVPVNSQTADAREAGFARALARVLEKLSGDAGIVTRPGVAQELRNAKAYVDSYDFRQDQGVSASGAPTFRTVLVVRFLPEVVDSMAAALGLPVWPQPRPKPVLWLAIDDGSGARLLSTGQVNAARSVLDRAQERGFRLGLPAGDAAEQAAVGAIWRGDSAAVARTSARYSPPMQLIGKLYRSGAGWTADWTFVDSGRVLATRSVSDSDARRAMASGADLAAEALVQRYAKVPPSEPAGTYRVAFTGLHSADDYLRVSAMLQKMPVVRRIAPARADGDRAEFDLDLLTGMAGFDRMLGADAPVVAVEGLQAEYRIR